MYYVRRRVPYSQELEFYGEVELLTARYPWWYGTWYSQVLPFGVRGGVPYDTVLEHIGKAEFELARRHRWSLGVPIEVTDAEARQVVSLSRPAHLGR